MLTAILIRLAAFSGLRTSEIAGDHSLTAVYMQALRVILHQMLVVTSLVVFLWSDPWRCTPGRSVGVFWISVLWRPWLHLVAAPVPPSASLMSIFGLRNFREAYRWLQPRWLRFYNFCALCHLTYTVNVLVSAFLANYCDTHPPVYAVVYWSGFPTGRGCGPLTWGLSVVASVGVL